MPIATGKIQLRSNTQNKTNSALLTAIMNFLVNSGNYTLITNQITASNYFVVQSTRETGFVGDKIIAQIGIQGATGGTYFWRPFIFMRCYESWSGTTGTNQGTFRLGSGSNLVSGSGEHMVMFSTTEDTDIWISCDETFILSMSRLRTGDIFNDGTNVLLSYTPAGIVAIERLSGDNDSGTFYGSFSGIEQGYNTTRRIYVPKRFDNATGDSAFFNINTVLGSTTARNLHGLDGPDESGSHIALDLNVHLASSGKIKGKVFGVKISTSGYFFGFGDSIQSPTKKYIVGRRSVLPDKSANGSILMEVAPTITTITL